MYNYVYQSICVVRNIVPHNDIQILKKKDQHQLNLLTGKYGYKWLQMVTNGYKWLQR